MRLDDLTGRKFSRLEVLERCGTLKHPNGKTTPVWWCKCDCGNLTTVSSTNLKSGTTRSCGCLRSEIASKNSRTQRAQGLSTERTYNIYLNMLDRCFNPNNIRFYDYGGRGITVCKEWTGVGGFLSFRKWAFDNGYADGLSLDRIDNDGDYSPFNCRWATTKEQACNKRNNHFLIFNGEKRCIAEWAELTRIKSSTLFARISRGWDTERALTEPIHKKRGVKS